MRRYHRDATQSLTNRCKALCVPFLSHQSRYKVSIVPILDAKLCIIATFGSLNLCFVVFYREKLFIKTGKKMLLSSYLKRDNNNLDLVRIIAACMVIYGHAYAISPQVGKDDIIHQLIGFDYSGSLAVKIFFFVSGLVVTNSFFSKRNINDFVSSRFFRIWPAFATVVIIGYLIGISISTLSASEFMIQTPFIPYLLKSLTQDITWSFPGVFSTNNINTFNGSLWTIIYEVGAYIVLMATMVLFKYNKAAITLFCLFIIADPIILDGFILKLTSLNDEVKYLPVCFSIGVLFGINKDSIEIKSTTLLMLVLITAIFSSQESGLSKLLFYISLMYGVLYFSSTPLFLSLKVKNDISYGIYLWGFPVQQIVASAIGNYSIIYNQVASIFISIIAGTLSWILIEKRFI
ncbi:acyltransferase, partial [Salmonella enterica]|nr:acyltransferase [Salmonella enterica]